MQINELLKTIKLSREKKKGQARNNREDILNTCLKAINSERVGTKWEPMTFVALKMQVQHVPDNDLYDLKELCLKRDSFGKAWFGILK